MRGDPSVRGDFDLPSRKRTRFRVALTKYDAGEEHQSQRSWRAAVQEARGLILIGKDISAQPRTLSGE